MQEFSRKEKFTIANTLSCVPLILQGEAVLIDLRNETSVAGRIANADANFNIHLTDVVFIDRLGQQYPFEQYMVRERMVRQIHIPPYINMDQELRDWVQNGAHRRKPRATSQRGKGKRTFKQKRAEERHKEILNEIKQTQKEKPVAK